MDSLPASAGRATRLKDLQIEFHFTAGETVLKIAKLEESAEGPLSRSSRSAFGFNDHRFFVAA